ncbi:MAG: calcium/sodium antiporter [Thermoanaerobaculia bacterium]
MSVLTIVLFCLGIAALVAGADLLVRGASSIAVAAGISPLVVGLTVVAYGTSAPELAVSVSAALAGHSDLAVGNVVGSNIANILLILGISAVAAPLVVHQQLIRLDVPLMIGIFGVLYLMSLDGVLSRIDGIVLAIGSAVYTVFAILKSRRETRRVRQEYEKKYGEAPETPRRRHAGIDLLLIAAGTFLLWLGARWLVHSATVIASLFGISQLVIGLTVVAVGTGLPELATSVIASFRGERDISVGNVVGSNIFNVLAVLGVTAMVAPAGVGVPASAVSFDMPVMLAVAVACLPIFFNGYRIARWEGAIFVFYYAAYVAYLVLQATEHDALPIFSRSMMTFVIPITVLTLIVVTLRSFRRQIRDQS